MALVILLVILAGFVVLVLAARTVHPDEAHGANTRAQVVLHALAVIASIVPGVLLLIVPSYSSGRTLLEANGAGAMIPLIIPPLLTALPAFARRPQTRTRACAALGTVLGVLSFIAGFSIGLFYVPAAALLVSAGAAGITPPRTAEP